MKLLLVLLTTITLAFNKPAETIVDSAQSETKTFCYSENSLFSYKDIFASYYQKISHTQKVIDGNIDLEIFMRDYYSSGLSLIDYTNSYLDNNNEAYQIQNRSNTAYYALGSDDYSLFPPSCFNGVIPTYDSSNAYYYGLMQEGDIIYESTGNSLVGVVGHIAFLYDKERLCAYGTMILTIEALPEGGVQFGFLDDNRMVDFGVEIYRAANVTAYDVGDAQYFMYSQLGDEYEIFHDTPDTSINGDKWYCSELVWAAYYYTGIDIASINGNTAYWMGLITPSNIVLSDNTYQVTLYMKNIRINSAIRGGNICMLTYYNATTMDLTIQYNSKLCFDNDAANWTNLYDLTNKQIMSYHSETVNISTNWFATTAVCGYVDSYVNQITGDTHYFRYITYANDFNLTSYSVHYVIQSWIVYA